MLPPSPSLAHGVKTSVLLSLEARRCLLRALSGFCSVVLTSRRSAISTVDHVFCQRDLSLVHKFPRKVFRCTKNGVWSFAGLHPSRKSEQPSFEHVEFCAAFIKFHICALIKNHVKHYGMVVSSARNNYINIQYIYIYIKRKIGR